MLTFCGMYLSPSWNSKTHIQGIRLTPPPSEQHVRMTSHTHYDESPQVYGIEGQTNTLSDPPLHVDHGDAIYLGIGRRVG